MSVSGESQTYTVDYNCFNCGHVFKKTFKQRTPAPNRDVECPNCLNFTGKKVLRYEAKDDLLGVRKSNKKVKS